MISFNVIDLAIEFLKDYDSLSYSIKDMLGEQIGEGKGKILSQRVIDIRDGIPKIEVSFTSSGRFKGIEVTELATYSTTPRSDGVLYGEGYEVVLSKDGKETVTWTGQGIG